MLDKWTGLKDDNLWSLRHIENDHEFIKGKIG